MSLTPQGKYVIAREDAATDVKKGKGSAFQVYMNLVRVWPNQLQVWPFKFGIPALGLTAAVTGALINRHFRACLCLVEHGRVTSYLATSVFPGATSMILQTLLVVPKLFEDNPQCSVCLQLRSSLIHTSTAFLHPLILTPLISYPIARALSKYSVPRITTSNPMRIFNFTKELVAPKSRMLSILFMVNVILSMFVTYQQQVVFYDLLKPSVEVNTKKP